MEGENMKKMRKAKDTVFGGALLLQSSKLITKPMTTANMIDTSIGFVGIGVAGTMADIAFDMVEGKKRKKRKRR